MLADLKSCITLYIILYMVQNTCLLAELLIVHPKSILSLEVWTTLELSGCNLLIDSVMYLLSNSTTCLCILEKYICTSERAQFNFKGAKRFLQVGHLYKLGGFANVHGFRCILRVHVCKGMKSCFTAEQNECWECLPCTRHMTVPVHKIHFFSVCTATKMTRQAHYNQTCVWVGQNWSYILYDKQADRK